MKEAVRDYWDSAPCGTKDIRPQEGTPAFFEALEERRYYLEPFISSYAQFERWKGKKVLEIGCGPGIDLVSFARAGAQITAIDLSPHSVGLAQRWLSINGFSTTQASIGDAENLPFEDEEFDFVYSWGVLHHTPHIEDVVKQIDRVLKPGARFCVMLYHKPSLVTLQSWLVYGLLAGRPLRDINDILASHMESLGTRAFTRKEVTQLFSNFTEVDIVTVVTPYDVRLGRRLFLPHSLRIIVPKRFGWFLVAQGRKRD